MSSFCSVSHTHPEPEITQPHNLPNTPQALCKWLGIDPTEHLSVKMAAKQYPLKITSCYLDKIKKGDPEDPLLLQVLPQAEETYVTPNEKADPVGDIQATLIPGLIQKYPNRVLIYTNPDCGIHCRFCFRRNSNNQLKSLSGGPEPIIRHLANDTSIHEVILSGGEPLLLERDRLMHLFDNLESIPHIKRIRIHTRIPVCDPCQIDSQLLDRFTRLSKTLSIVVHCNHPQEICHQTSQAFNSLNRNGVHLFSQTVMLRRINDRPEILTELFEHLFMHGVIPYYLHLLDPAPGTSHFHVPDHEALSLWKTLQERLPGYLVPRLVREIGGKPCKQIII